MSIQHQWVLFRSLLLVARIATHLLRFVLIHWKLNGKAILEIHVKQSILLKKRIHLVGRHRPRNNEELHEQKSFSKKCFIDIK